MKEFAEKLKKGKRAASARSASHEKQGNTSNLLTIDWLCLLRLQLHSVHELPLQQILLGISIFRGITNKKKILSAYKFITYY